MNTPAHDKDRRIAGPVTPLDAKTGPVAAPTFVRPKFERMPAELKTRPNWVLWVAVWNGSKWTKRPIQPSGYGASTTNPKHWSPFEAVKQAYECAVARGYVELHEKDKPPQRVRLGGVGFVFDGKPDENGLVIAGVDFDDVVSSAGVSALAQQQIEGLGSYTELSVSGTGLHVIIKAQPLSAGVTHGGVELYTKGRFFTMTGRAPDGALADFGSASVVAAPGEFAALAEELRNEAGRRASSNIVSPPNNVVPFKPPAWAANTRPAAAFANLPAESLAAGFEPNMDKIRAAAAAIPSSAIATEPEWMELARALAHEAAVHKDYREPLWQILDEVSSRAPGYNQEENRRRFERYISEALNRSEPITIGTLYHMALAHGWDGRASSNIPSAAVTAAVTQPRAVHISHLPLVPPKREWLHGTDLVRGAVTVLVAPGGRAKSTWLLACALACASGRDWLGSHVFGGPLRVLCLSTEDGMSEMSLRLRAAMQHFGLTDADVPGLYVIGADSWGLALLQADRYRAVPDDGGMSALAAELDHTRPDVLIIDPLINVMGGVSANDNAAAAMLMRQLVRLATERQMAVALAHHTSKGRDVASAESAMGAASFTNLARIALSIERLDPSKAGTIGVPSWEAGSLFRVIPTKQNFSPPSTEDRWFRLVSVSMPNAAPPIYMDGDRVAVVEPFHFGVSGPAFAVAVIRDALRAVDEASPPLTPSKRSPDRYAAPVIAEAIKSHVAGQVSDLDGKAVLDHLMSTGLVAVAKVKVPRDDGKGSDDRKGLVLTPAGKVELEEAAKGAVADPAPQPPQPPQSPATTLRDDAGGDPHGSPATQGGCGGNAGGRTDDGDVPRTGDKDEIL